MGGEQAHHPLVVVQEHAAHRLGRLQVRMAGDLLQGRNHGVGVLGQLHGAGVGDELALARDRHLHDDGQHIADGRDRQGEDDEQPRPAPAAAAAAAGPAGPHDRAVDQLRRQGDDSGEHRGDDHQPDVAVDDVGHLVGEHRLQLPVVQGLGQGGGDGDAVLALVQASGEGVHGVGLDNPQRRGLHPARDRQVFQEVIDSRLIFAGDRTRAGRGVDDGLVREIGDHEPDQRRPDGQGRELQQQDAGLGKVAIQAPCGRQGPEPHHHQDHGVEHGKQQDRETRQQQPRSQVVVPDVGLQPDGAHVRGRG